jgi:hypothetical protein
MHAEKSATAPGGLKPKTLGTRSRALPLTHKSEPTEIHYFKRI